jgi:hypothetical protein
MCNSLIQNVSTPPERRHRQRPPDMIGRIRYASRQGGPRPSWCKPRHDADRPLRVGVVGVGVMGSNHARVFADLPGVKLVGVA